MSRRTAHIHTTSLKTTYCPVCINTHEAVTGVHVDVNGPARPKPGDYTMCTACGALLKFDDQMNERAVAPEEEAEYIASLDGRLKAVFLARRARARNASHDQRGMER